MKKFLWIMLCLMFIPLFVDAKEYCSIVKGSGKDIGDEIKCGTESFYIVYSGQNEISMLAKYNLFVGDKIDYISVDENDSTLSDNNYCMQFGQQAGYDPYYVVPMYDEASQNLKGCRLYEVIDYDRVVQDSRAVGTKLVNGRSVLPLYGIVYMNPEWGYDTIRNGITYENNYDRNGNLILSTTGFERYINGYKEELERQNIEVNSVSFITLSKTLQLLKDISGENVIVDLEYPDYNHDTYEFYYGKMDIKNYLGNNYKWIYDVTYWLGSGFIGDPNTDRDYHNDYYISNEGMLCAIGRGECSYFPYPIGNGIRPLVNIPKSAVRYNIHTKTDGNGTIEVVNSAYGNEAITFRVIAKKGYKLDELIVTTDSGEIIVFNSGSMVNNPDGTVSINNNAFTMPFENVTIEARWSITNPKTGTLVALIIVVLLSIAGLSIYSLKRKKRKSY